MKLSFFLRGIFFLLVLLLCSFEVGAQKDSLSRDQCIEDLKFLSEALIEIHPSVPRYTDSKDIQHHIDSLINDLPDSLSAWQFQKKIRSVLVLVGCIHTDAYAKKTKKKARKKRKPLKQMPFSFYTDGKGIFVDEVKKEVLKDFLGAEVYSIEGITAPQILERLYKYRSGDGQIKPFMDGLLNNGDNFRVLLEAYIDLDTTVSITLIPKDGIKRQMELKREVIEPKKGTPPKQQKWTYQIKNHHYKTDSLLTYGYLKIPSFHAKSGWRKFYKKVIRHLNDNRIEHFAIDLRGCPGGNIFEAQLLLSMIMDTSLFYTMQKQRKPIWKYVSGQSKMFILADWMKWDLFSFTKKAKDEGWKYYEQGKKANKKINYDGQVYVLVDGISSSSATVVASYLKEFAGAIVIGSETGGGAAGNAGLYYPKSKLPQSKIQIRMPQYWLDYHLLEDAGRGVIPDIHIQYSVEESLEEKDKEMEAFLKIVNKNGKI